MKAILYKKYMFMSIAMLYLFPICAEEALKSNVVYRVECGSSQEYKDSRGNIWLPDLEFKPGVTDYGYIDGGSGDRGNIAIDNTADPRIYQTERYNLKEYKFIVPNGLYTVKLHFAETYDDKPGGRVFDVLIEGNKVLENFDIFSKVGSNTALVKKFKHISVSDGELSIGFVKNPVTPEINGIEVIQEQ